MFNATTSQIGRQLVVTIVWLMKQLNLITSLNNMDKELVTYEVELDSPDFFVSFQAEKGLSLEQIEFLAIQEMTRNTRVWNVKIVE